MPRALRTDAFPLHEYRQDNDPQWLWLESREDPQVEAFLHAANRHSDACLAPLKPLEQALYDGQLARRELAVVGLPTELDHYRYHSEIQAEAEYPCWWRQALDDNTAPELILDFQARGQAREFLEVGDMAISADETWLAWTEDDSGDEYFDLYLKHLPDGEPRRLLSEIGPELVWAEDNRTLFFTRFDTTQRPASVWKLRPTHGDSEADAASAEGTRVFEEADGEFWIGLGKSRSRGWLMIETASKETSECHLIPADQPDTPPVCFRPRETGVEYALEHRGETFYVMHNRGATHFRLDTATLDAPERLTPVIAHRNSVTLEGVDAFAWGIVVTERDHDEAQVYLRILDDSNSAPDSPSTTADYRLALNHLPGSVALDDTPQFATRKLTLREESFTQPPRWLEHDLDSGEQRVLKTLALHGDLLPQQLASRRIWATSTDGEQVPVSIVARADLLGAAPLPTLLYGYGAYGEILDPWFSISRLELLSRGIAFAVAHVRGGGERGEPWYLAGKLAHKHNSFDDFLAARHALVDTGLSAPQRIVASGASAGGLLVGASLNLEPEAFCAAVLDVPFVDVLRTMENPELPLTTAEYTEWGNPQDPDVRERIRGYSPLDNLAARPYPSLLIQGSWHDSRVAYWEPAKLFARLTAMASARGPVLLRTEMDAGHGGASGRFKAWRENARQDAFIVWALGCSEVAAGGDEACAGGVMKRTLRIVRKMVIANGGRPGE